MTITQNEALDAMLQHHRGLVEDVEHRVTALATAVNSGISHEPSVAELLTYLAEQVLPHARVEELSFYRVAAARADLANTVNEMITEHRVLVAAIESLANAPTAASALTQAMQIATFFTTHISKENELLLPALHEDSDVDLVQLLEQMHHLSDAAPADPPSRDLPNPDSEAAVLSLLLKAAKELSEAGRGDTACQLVASAWAALRSSRPALAAKTTANLHRLVMTLAKEPITLRSQVRNTDAVAIRELDVRHLALAQRHETIFIEFHALTPGTGYILVNDHDPKPLRYQFEAEHTGEFTWDVLESGPQVWRVSIAKPFSSSVNSTERGGDEASNDQELDVRILPHGQRHEIIFSTYDHLDPGGAFVIVNDHDPKPLRYQFEARHAGEFTWDYLESGPKIWRVRVRRIPISMTA